jgi:Stress responsive A/B Barrel Domain
MNQKRLAHHVFFTLKERTPEATAALVAACHKYLTVQAGIVYFAAGPLCKELDRPVNDLDFDVNLTVVFDSKASHDTYQTDETHNQFIAENKPTWAKVRVFDSYV